MKQKGANVNTSQFHLRVTQETYDKIKAKAAEMSLSVSDYVVFIVTHFDVVEISRKIDEINARLDAIEAHEAQSKGN